jgi:hypothetical protein
MAAAAVRDQLPQTDAHLTRRATDPRYVLGVYQPNREPATDKSSPEH